MPSTATSSDTGVVAAAPCSVASTSQRWIVVSCSCRRSQKSARPAPEKVQAGASGAVSVRVRSISSAIRAYQSARAAAPSVAGGAERCTALMPRVRASGVASQTV